MCVLFPSHWLLCKLFEDVELAQEGGAFLLVVYVGWEHEFVHSFWLTAEEILVGTPCFLEGLGRGFVEAN